MNETLYIKHYRVPETLTGLKHTSWTSPIYCAFIYTHFARTFIDFNSFLWLHIKNIPCFASTIKDMLYKNRILQRKTNIKKSYSVSCNASHKNSRHVLILCKIYFVLKSLIRQCSICGTPEQIFLFSTSLGTVVARRTYITMRLNMHTYFILSQ